MSAPINARELSRQFVIDIMNWQIDRARRRSPDAMEKHQKAKELVLEKWAQEDRAAAQPSAAP